jgi:glycosyltransferase involved in cell wall biosynthesis
MFVNGSLYGGGAEHVIATLARHLREMAHPVTVAAVHGGGEVLEELQADGFTVVTTGGGRGSTASALRQVIDERGVQVVHSHDLRSLIDAGTCRLRSRRFAHMHTFHFGNYPHLPWKPLLMEAAAARIPDQLVAVGNVQRTALSRALRLRESKVTTIWNGVDYVGRPDWSGVARDSAVPRIGSVSTFGLQKGLPTLLEAAKIAHDRGLRFRLVLVGEGPLRGELEAMATAFGLAECVEFTGWQPDAARTLLPTFDIFVQSSHWEAMSVVILEAMAARRPIVATTVGENTAVLTHDESAILVPPRDAAALANGLARVIEDAALRARLAEAAYAAYATRFTGRAMAERYAAAYRDCLATRGLG